MFVLQPVVEVQPHDGFALWPVADAPPWSFLALSGSMAPGEVGTAVVSLASYNGIEPGDTDWPEPPADPAGALVHGLTVRTELLAPGGLRVTDTASGHSLTPGCCCGLEGWREWYGMLDGDGPLWLGHDPEPRAELLGDAVRLTLDTSRPDSPVLELPAAELRTLLTGAERDLTEFRALAAGWAAHLIPDHARAVTGGLGRALGLPG